MKEGELDSLLTFDRDGEGGREPLSMGNRSINI